MKVKKVLGSRLFLKIDRTNETKTGSGIILKHAEKQENQIGEIVIVGTSCIEEFKVGQKVAYSKYGAEDTSELGENLIFVEENDVLAIVKE